MWLVNVHVGFIHSMVVQSTIQSCKPIFAY